MIRDVTNEVKTASAPQIEDALDALVTLSKHFGRETLSAALGEISERMIAHFVGAERRERNTKGHDLVKDARLIEVKSRLIDRWQDDAQFNFSRHTTKAQIAYCLAWRTDDQLRPQLVHVFEVGVPFLIAKWAKPNQPTFSARTTLGRLKSSLLSHTAIQQRTEETKGISRD